MSDEKFGFHLGNMDVEAFMGMLRWLQDAMKARGAKVEGFGMGLGQSDVDIMLEGHRYNVSIRPLDGKTPRPTPEDQPYAAAILTFLNRDEHQTKSAMCYPIAKVELLNVFDDRVPEKARKFAVSDLEGKHGIWVEEQ
jgi:hypothetical protein